MSRIDRKKRIYLIIIVTVLLLLALARGILYIVRARAPGQPAHAHSTRPEPRNP